MHGIAYYITWTVIVLIYLVAAYMLFHSEKGGLVLLGLLMFCFYAILLIISISIVFDFNQNMAKFANNHAPWRAIIVDYYANFIPYFANLFSPLFVFIAVIFFTSKLAGNSEIIAMLASGTSFRRLLRPYMLSAALIAGINYYLGAYVIPNGNIVRQNFETQYKNKKKNTSASNVQLQVGPGVIAYIQQYDNNAKRGYGFALYKFDQKIRRAQPLEGHEL